MLHVVCETCSLPCCISMFMQHVHVQDACLFPYLCCTSMSMVHVHVHGPSSCPWCMFIVHAACTCLGYMSLSMLHVHVHVHDVCPCPCCMTMSILHDHVHVNCAYPMSTDQVLVHGTCPCPWCMSMHVHFYTVLHEISVEYKNWCDIPKNISLNFLEKAEFHKNFTKFHLRNIL